MWVDQRTMLRRGMKEDGTVNGGLGYSRPWYCASSNLGPPRGKAFQGNTIMDNVASSRSCPTASSSCNETVKGTQMTRKCGRPVSQGDRQKRAVSGSGRFMIQQELDFPRSFSPSGATEDQTTTHTDTPRSEEKTLRSILKQETNARPKSSQDLPFRKLPEDDNRIFASAVTTNQQEWPCMPCQPQTSQTSSTTWLPQPIFRRSRIPRCTFFNSNGDFHQPRSISSDECCYRRWKSSLESQHPVRRESAGSKKKSDAKLQTEKERSAVHGWGCATATGGQFGGTSDWGVATGSRSVPGYGAASGIRVETSDPNHDRKSTKRAQSEDDLRRNPRRSPQMDEQRCSDEFQNSRRCSSNLVHIVTEIPSPRHPKSLARDITPLSMSSKTSGSTRPYYRQIFENMFDWLSKFADTQWTNLKMIKQAAENYVVPITRTSSDPELPCTKSFLTTTSSQVQTNPSSCFSSTRSRSGNNNSSEQEQYPSLHKVMSSEEKWGAIRRQKNPGDPKLSNSRPELKSSEGQSCYSKTPGRPSDPTISRSAMEITGSRLDRMQESAADTITQMRGPDFVFPRKLLKSETLLTKALTKEFEEVSSMPSSSRRTAQLRKLLSELPVENFYVVEWLVTNSIIKESNASKFGHLFHVKPHVLEVLTRNRELLFPDAL